MPNIFLEDYLVTIDRTTNRDWIDWPFRLSLTTVLHCIDEEPINPSKNVGEGSGRASTHSKDNSR